MISEVGGAPSVPTLEERLAVEALSDPGADQSETGAALPPLAVSGLVITKDALVEALRIYMPQLVDVVAVEGSRFLLSVEPLVAEQQNGANHG